MNDYGLKKNTEGYADPTAAATLNRKEPGDIWEYNGGECLIIKNHGYFSSILLLVDGPAGPNNVQVQTSKGLRISDPRRLTYGKHDKIGRYVETLNAEDFAYVIESTEVALGIELPRVKSADNEATPKETQEARDLRKKLDTAQARILELEDQLGEYEGTVLGLERQLAAATKHINNGAVDKAQAEAEKARNQLELLRDMYNELLVKVVKEA